MSCGPCLSDCTSGRMNQINFSFSGLYKTTKWWHEMQAITQSSVLMFTKSECMKQSRNWAAAAADESNYTDALVQEGRNIDWHSLEEEAVCSRARAQGQKNNVAKRPHLMHFNMHRQKTTTSALNIFPSENHHSFLAAESCRRKWEEKNRLSAQREQRSQRCHSAHYFRSREYNFSRHARALFQKWGEQKSYKPNRKLLGTFT